MGGRHGRALLVSRPEGEAVVTTARHPAAWWAPITLGLDRSDAHPQLVDVALIGLGVAGALALFGLPPVDLHSPLHHLGIMDPLCGGTRGLRAAALGRFGQAWSYDPLSVVLFVGACAALARVAVGRLTRRWLTVHRGRGVPFWLGLSAALAALEVNQQAHAAFLMR